MNNMAPVIVPQSTQQNADDFLSGPRTIKITAVKITPGAEQPCAISFEGDQNKPYFPCKSMARVLVNCWGPDANNYIGRSLTLYCDPAVTWGGMAVGGIRISHMSDIPSAQVMALTATRGNKKPFKVLPLIIKATSTEAGAIRVEELRATASDAADQGTEALTKFWGTLSKPERLALKDAMPAFKATAAANDPPPNDDAPFPGDAT